MEFSNKQINQLHKAYDDVQREYIDFFLSCSKLILCLTDNKIKEYFQHGFMRRLTTIKRCVDNIYKVWPPERSSLLSKEEREDVTINLQAFIFNIYGSIENLRSIFYKIRNKIKHEYVKELEDYLVSEKYITWKEYLNNFRHALAHRIPLYIPPFVLSPEETKKYYDLGEQMKEALQKMDFSQYERIECERDALGKICPLMTHSFSEKAKEVVFHAQIIADFNTVIKFADKIKIGVLNL